MDTFETLIDEQLDGNHFYVLQVAAGRDVQGDMCAGTRRQILKRVPVQMEANGTADESGKERFTETVLWSTSTAIRTNNRKASSVQNGIARQAQLARTRIESIQQEGLDSYLTRNTMNADEIQSSNRVLSSLPEIVRPLRTEILKLMIQEPTAESPLASPQPRERQAQDSRHPALMSQ